MRHHYIPVFYLKQWTTGDGRLCEYRKHANGAIKPKRKFPAGTGYVDGLYDLTVFDDPILRDTLEREFMSPVDSQAAEQLREMVAGDRAMNNPDKRSAWTRFMLSLMFRTPEDVKLHREHYLREWMTPDPVRRAEYKKRWRPGLPETLEGFLELMDPADIERRAMEALVPLINNERIGEHLVRMRWGSLKMPFNAPALLTSDRPLIVSNGLQARDSHILMPVSPKLLFYAVNETGIINFLLSRGPADLAKMVNTVVARQAVTYVYGQWDVQLAFVQEHMGTGQLPSLTERMADHRERPIKQRVRRERRESP